MFFAIVVSVCFINNPKMCVQNYISDNEHNKFNSMQECEAAMQTMADQLPSFGFKVEKISCDKVIGQKL